MAALVTENPRSPFGWSKDSKDRKIWSGTRTFKVSGVADWEAAEAALVAAFPNTAEGATHPGGGGATVTSIGRDRVSAGGFYELTVNYSSNGGDDLELLLSPPEIDYDPFEYTIESDRDLDKIPYVNTGNFPFDRPMLLPGRGLILTISMWMSAYPLALDMAYGGRVCDGNFAIPDGNLVTDGQALFLGFFKKRRATNSLMVWVEAKFDMRAEGHQQNTVDQGALGWYLSAVPSTAFESPGAFCGIGWDSSLAGVVRLDGTGLPISPSIYVKPTKPSDGKPLVPIAPPVTSPSAALLNATLSSADIKILTFRRRFKIPFSGLGL